MMTRRMRSVLCCLLLILPACEPREKSPPKAPPAQSRFQEFRPLREDLADPLPTAAEAQELASLGYLSGYRKATQEGGVRILNKAKMAPGLTLFTSGHAPEALLIDADGTVVHSWRKEFSEIFPEVRPSDDAPAVERTTYWRFAEALPDGALLAIFEGLALVKLAPDSSVIWARLNHAHHDLEVASDGSIVVLTREVATGQAGPYLDEHIVTLSAEGEERARISIVDALEGSPLRREILGSQPLRGDALHTNSIQVIPADTRELPEGVQAGDYLISMRHTHSLVIISKRTHKAVWTFKDDFRFQHFARIEAGSQKLMLFDNLGKKSRSRVLEYRFPTMQLMRTFEGPDPLLPFFTEFCGLAQPLDNGNILIAESEAGRLLEITPENTVVWEYLSPFRAGERLELVAILAHAARVPSGILGSTPGASPSAKGDLSSP